MIWGWCEYGNSEAQLRAGVETHNKSEYAAEREIMNIYHTGWNGVNIRCDWSGQRLGRGRSERE